MNKWTFYNLALEYDAPVPVTVSPFEDGFIEKVKEFIKYPCLVKSVFAYPFREIFGRKLNMVNNKEELLDKVRIAAEKDIDVVVQKNIPGFDDHIYTFDAYLNQNAKVTHWITLQKLRQYPINFGSAVYAQVKYMPALCDMGAKFLEAIEFKGFAGIEFKKDTETGKFYILEVNVRTTGLNNLMFKAGINMPYIAYKELTGDPVKPKAVIQNANFVFRYAYEDFFAMRKYIKTGQLTAKKVMNTYFRPRVHAVWDWKDPKPAFAFSKKMTKKLLWRFNYWKR